MDHEPHTENRKKAVAEANKSLLWDCGSSLYDSFELKSFERQLDSFISCRSYSMPRFPSKPSIFPPPPPPLPSSTVSKKPYSKISRSLNKFLRSIFRPRHRSTVNYGDKEQTQDGLCVVEEDQFGVLSAISEMQEKSVDYIGGLPEHGPMVRRSASERFTATSIGISCA